MRNMYVMAVAGPEVVLDVSEATRRELIQELPLFGVDRLARLLGVLGDVAGELKTSTNPRLTFEIALTRMVRPDADVTLEALAERVETLERQLAAPLSRGCRACCACGSGPRRGRPWSPLGSVRISVKRQSFCRARGGRPKARPYGGDCLDSDSRCDRPGSGCPCVCCNRPGCRCPCRSEPGCSRPCVGDLGCHCPTGANPAAAVPAGSSPVGGDLGRPSAPAGSAPCDSQSVPLAEGGSVSAPTGGVAPTATPVAVAPAPSTACAPVPAPSAPAAAGSLSPEIVATLSNMAALQRLWAGVLASLKKSKAAYGVPVHEHRGLQCRRFLIEFP